MSRFKVGQRIKFSREGLEYAKENGAVWGIPYSYIIRFKDMHVYRGSDRGNILFREGEYVWSMDPRFVVPCHSFMERTL